MTDTFTYSPVHKTTDGRPAAGTWWQWQRQTVGSIFTSQQTFKTWPEAEEAAEAMARINRGKFVVSGAEIQRRAAIRQMCDADAIRNDDGLDWLRAFTTIEDVLSGTIPDVPAVIYEDPDTYQGVTYPINGERFA